MPGNVLHERCDAGADVLHHQRDGAAVGELMHDAASFGATVDLVEFVERSNGGR